MMNLNILENIYINIIVILINIILPSRNGPYCFKIHGDIYHHISSLYPGSCQNPSYGQLYILDFAEANKVKLNKSQNIQLKVMC